MELKNIDILILKFKEQSLIDCVEVHIRVEKKEFLYSALPVSNNENSERFHNFKEQMDDFFKLFPYSKIHRYLSNISMIEATVHLNDIEKIIASKKIAGIQMLENSAKYFNYF